MAMENRDLVYDLPVPCCGETYRVRRTLELALHVEQQFGPIFPLSRRLRVMEVGLEELALLVRTLVKDEPDAPSKNEIRAWLYQHGGARLGPLLAGEVLTLIAGNEAVAEYVARRDHGNGEDAGPGPFAPRSG